MTKCCRCFCQENGSFPLSWSEAKKSCQNRVMSEMRKFWKKIHFLSNQVLCFIIKTSPANSAQILEAKRAMNVLNLCLRVLYGKKSNKGQKTIESDVKADIWLLGERLVGLILSKTDEHNIPKSTQLKRFTSPYEPIRSTQMSQASNVPTKRMFFTVKWTTFSQLYRKR